MAAPAGLVARPGLRFLHSRQIDGNGMPAVCVVTAVRGEWVYYRNHTGSAAKTPDTGFAASVRAVLPAGQETIDGARVRLDGEAGRRFTLYGERGAVEYAETPAGEPRLVFHDPYPPGRQVTPEARESQDRACDVLPRCWAEEAPAGALLIHGFHATGDDEMIWAALIVEYQARWPEETR